MQKIKKISKKSKNKKAQTEIVGLVIIVIILVIGSFIIISINTNKRKISQRFLDPKLADNFLSSILNTNTEKNLKVVDIIKACYENKHDMCGQNSNCCAYAENTIKNALEATLGNWSRDYRFSIRRDNEPNKINDIPINSKCLSRFVEKEQVAEYPLPILYPPVFISLEICNP
ncbi:MAG: hypothetical protein QXE31_05660 [Candidatus Woesearchaeota archaeon]